MVSFALVTILLLGFAGAFFLLHRKNRLIWRELFQLRQEHRSIHSELLEVRKQIVLETCNGGSRLPLLLPSQNAEDLLLWNFFGRKRSGFFIEVGAYDGIGFSNTYFLEALGWDGILVEAVPEFYEVCRLARPNSRVINAVAGTGNGNSQNVFVAYGAGGVGTLSFSGNNPEQLDRIKREGGAVRKTEVPVVSLNQLLKNHQGGIDFVSIDVEGSELDVLHGFDLEKFRPRVLVIEDNSGGADNRVGEYLSTYDYQERLRCEQNVFYTKSDDSGLFSLAACNEVTSEIKCDVNQTSSLG